jgi:hypothetical protein
MGARLILSALALAICAQAGVVAADDPRDPTMNAAGRARDKAIIKRLNQEQLAHVRARDARYAEGWRSYRNGGTVSQRDASDYAERRAHYQRGQRDYAEARESYAQRMAAWRRAVAACRAGDRSACD